jgi:hypothetical protein
LAVLLTANDNVTDCKGSPGKQLRSKTTTTTTTIIIIIIITFGRLEYRGK